MICLNTSKGGSIVDDFAVDCQTDGGVTKWVFSGLEVVLPRGQSCSLSGEILPNLIDINVPDLDLSDDSVPRRVLRALLDRTSSDSPDKAKELNGVLLSSKSWDVNMKGGAWRNVRIMKTGDRFSLE
jgi:hypothetical protein